MKKYRKKPVIIEAVRYDGTNGADIIKWSEGKIAEYSCITPDDYTPSHYLSIKTLEGIMTGIIGEWIIKGVKGEFYPCKPDIFEATYELV